MKKVTIYGKSNCPWCDRAKELCQREGIEYEYINIQEAGIDGAKLSEICGERVGTVPQIFVDDRFAKGGFQGLANRVVTYKASIRKP